MRRNPRPIPVYLPTRGRQNSARPPARPVATVVLNPSTGRFEFNSISAFPPGAALSTAPLSRRSPSPTPSRASSSPAHRTTAAAGPRKAVSTSVSKRHAASSPLSGVGASRGAQQTAEKTSRRPSSPVSRPVVPTSRPSAVKVAYRLKPKVPAAPVENMDGPFTAEASIHDFGAIAPSTSVSRREILAKPVNTIRQGSQEYPVSAACALFACCSLAVVSALVLGLYLFSQSRDGQVMLTKALRFLSFVTKSTRAPSTATTGSAGVRVKVDIISHITDKPSVDISTSAHSTVKTVPPCRRILCAYQTSRWVLSSDEHPCDDFYSFVCGNWSQAGQNETSSFGTDQHKETEVLLHTLLEERRAEVPKDDEVVALYDTCLEPTSYADSKLFVSSLLQRLGLGKWPYKDNVLSQNEMWSIHARIFRALGISPLVTVSHVPDPKNDSESAIRLDIPPLYAKTDGDVRLPTWYLPSLYRATSMFDSDFYEDVSQRVLQFRWEAGSTSRQVQGKTPLYYPGLGAVLRGSGQAHAGRCSHP
ncbi:hypothetical protein HPB51_002455 [Rhipicephalus microplus]|uniref:Peptidase M13 N-terminal domain-containing protein n=1 Tax=Rhipicephalus microplus TaxID=6941 RepID=A0A9J6DES0_RHIMP|nr:hypothetical protein HPB51_002455 [Rhipicephalus microplus]